MTDDKRAQCSATTDTEIYRRPSPDDTDSDGYYQPYLSITKQGALMICVAGRCITMPIESWLSLAANDKKPDGWKYGDYIELVEEYEEECGMSDSPRVPNPEPILKQKILKCLFRRDYHVSYDSSNSLHGPAFDAIRATYEKHIRPFKLVFLDEEK